MEPQVSVARVAQEAHLDYEISKQKNGMQASEAVRNVVSSLNPPNPPLYWKHASTTSTASTTSSSTDATMAASTTSPRNSTASSNTSNSKENDKRNKLTSSSLSSSTLAVVEPSAGMVRIERNDDYQAAKLISAVALDQQVKETFRNSAGAAGRQTPRNSNNFSLSNNNGTIEPDTGIIVPQRTMDNNSSSNNQYDAYYLQNTSESIPLEDDVSSSTRRQRPSTSSSTTTRPLQRRTTSGDELAARLFPQTKASTPARARSFQISAASSHDDSNNATTGLPNLIQRNEFSDNTTNISTRGETPTMTDNSAREATTTTSNQLEADARVKAGLRNARSAATVVGETPIMNDISAREATPSTTSESTQLESDAKVKAGLRNAWSAATSVGATRAMKDNSAREATTTTSNQLESDARVKAGLRNARPAATVVGATPTMNDNSIREVAPLTQTTGLESDAMVKAGLRNARPTATPGAVPIMNDNSATEVPPLTQMSRLESSDARVKAGLRNARPTTTTAGAVPMMNDNSASEVASLTQLSRLESSDARIKAGLRNARPAGTLIGATPMMNDNSATEITPLTQMTRLESSDARIKAGLRNARPTNSSTMVGVAAAAPSATNNEIEADYQIKAELRGNTDSRTSATVSPDDDKARIARPVTATIATRIPSFGSAIMLNDQTALGTSPGYESAEAEAERRSFAGLRSSNAQDQFMVVGYASNEPDDRLSREKMCSGTQNNASSDNDQQGQDSSQIPPDFVPVAQQSDKNSGGLLYFSAHWNKNRLWFIIALVVFVIVVAVAVAVAVSKASSPDGGDSQPPTDATEQSEASNAPLIDDKLSAVFPTTVFPKQTIEAIESKSNRLPQVQAYNWLLEDPNLFKYKEAQRLQRFVLATFYYATNGQDWLPEGIENNWMRYDVHECSWFSLAKQQRQTTCLGFDSEFNVSSDFEHYEYISLVLSGDPKLTEDTNGPYIYQRVKGTLPPELSLLSSLQRVDVGLQKLRGSIPDLGQLSSTLRDIILYDNDLTGTIPSSLFTFPENLWLSHNEFSASTIPTSVGMNSNLRSALLIGCKLTGSIPPGMFESKPNLRLLYLEENSLDGSLPSEIGLATTLEQFRVVQNKISGRIPTEVGRLSEMTTIWLDANKMTGLVVSELGNLTKLQSLSIGGNFFSGTLPVELSNLRQLRELKLSWDSLTGDFRNRNLNGTIPASYFRTVVTDADHGNGRRLRGLQSNVAGGSSGRNTTQNTEMTSNGRRIEPTLPHLQHFWLADTKITGSLPLPAMAMSENLQVIRMGQNRLLTPASLPTELGLLTNLVELDLAEINLVSTIPTELGNLVLLKQLKLQKNTLTGILPSELSALTSLTWVQVDGNVDLSGPVPSNICTPQIDGQEFTRGIGCPNDNVMDSGETSLCGCDCPACV